MTAPILYCDDGSERELPTKFEVCPQCEGKGKSSAYLGAFSGRRLEEMRDDPEWCEDYFGGRFDRPCETCKGLRVVPVVDERLCDPADLKAYIKQEREFAEMRQIERQERLFEGGWREEGWLDD